MTAAYVDTETGEVIVIEPSPLEERAGIRSIDALHAQRRAIIASHGKLLALFGPFGHYDDHRKRFVEAQKIRARMELQQQGVKSTEAMIDAMAYGSESYQRFIDNALEEKVEYLRVQAQLDEIAELIRSREEELRSYNRELSLAR